MKTFYITYICRNKYLEEFVQATTNTKAVQKLMNSLRKRGMPVNISILKVEVVKVIL